MTRKPIPVILAITLAVAGMACQKKDATDTRPGADSSAVDARPGMLPVPGGEVLARGPWMWAATITPTGRVAPPDPTQYTIEFLPDSTARLLLFCNRGSGNYRVAGKSLRIGPIATTRMMCPEPSLDVTYGQQLEAVRGWFMSGDTLMMDLFADSGTMRFVR
jgi:heat shock protein HslJ